jgi:hypothetical protein
MMLRIAAAIGIASLVTVIGFQFARILQINSACSRGPLQPSDRVGLARRKTETWQIVFLIFRFLRRCLDRLTMHMER